MMIERVAVVGAGTMGAGIAQLFAAHGVGVTLIDVRAELLDRAIANVGASLDRQIKRGDVLAAAKAWALELIRTSVALADAADAELVIEAATERHALKLEIFRDLDAIAAPSAILASNTSSISITEIAAATRRPGQVIGMHFMNPVPVMKLVEVIRGLETSDDTADTITRIAVAVGKTVAEARDYPGFVANRILMPMINEAMFCLMEGVADRDSIDTVMKLGMNHPLGPLALADLIGLDTCLAVMEVLHAGLGDDKYRPCPMLRQYVAAGRLGRKTGEGFYTYRPE